MEERKIYAIVVAFAMLAVGCAVVANSNSDATNANNGLAEYKFYIGNYEGSDWDYTVTGVGYNAYIALQNALGGLSQPVAVSATADGASYTKTVSSVYGSYLTINPDYGTIGTIGSMSAGSGAVWNVCMYNNQGNWVKGPVNALGFYQGYSDYDSSLRTANIILYLGDPSTDIAGILDGFTTPSNLKSITYIDDSSYYKVTFTLNVSSMSQPSYLTEAQWTHLQGLDGTTVFGYGSNCYTAFQNALSSVYGNSCMYNPVSQAVNSDSYGYVSSILGIEENSATSESSTTWWYWSLHTGAPVSSNYSLFTAGFFTPLSGVSGFQYSALYYNFEVSTY